MTQGFYQLNKLYLDHGHRKCPRLYAALEADGSPVFAREAGQAGREVPKGAADGLHDYRDRPELAGGVRDLRPVPVQEGDAGAQENYAPENAR